MFVFISQRNHLSPFYRIIEDAHDEERISPQVYRMLDAVNTPFEKIINWIWSRTEIKIVHINRRDLWSLDYTLAQVIYPAIVKFKEDNTISIPFVSDEDVPEEMRYEANNVTEFEADNELLEQRWQYVLNKIIFSFECCRNDITDQMEHRSEIDKGLELFGKYYQNFWI